MAAEKAAPRLLAYLEGTEEPQKLYGLFKQATCGDAPEANVSSGGGLKGRLKLQAWRAQSGRSATECRSDYVSLLDKVAERAARAVAETAAERVPRGLALQPSHCRDLNLRVRIVGTGRYLPACVVTNAEVAERGGFDPASQRSGVRERRRAAVGERAVEMAAKASRAALDDAGVAPGALWAILNASGTTEQAIPDGGSLLQAALGLGASGVRSFSVHATCLSFVSALEAAATMLERADCPRGAHILISSSEITSRHVDPSDPHTAPLFGDAAVAVVVRRASWWKERSRLHAARMETYGEGAALTCIRGGGTALPAHLPEGRHTTPNPACDFAANHFSMDGPATLRVVLQHGPGFLERLRPRLSTSLGDIQWAVPHQASGLALDAITDALGWPADRMLRTLDTLGNTVAASIPLTLHEGITSGRIQRGDKIVMFGTSAGISFGGIVLTY